MSGIEPKALKEGMILTETIEDRHGYVLFPAGIALTKEQILAIKKLGLEEVPAVPEGEGEVADNPNLVMAEEYVRNFFAYTDPDDPAILAMYEIAVLRVAGAIGKGWTLPTENQRLAKNVEYLRDVFEGGHGTAYELVDHEAKLASFPDIYFRIKEVLDSPTSSADDIAKVVSTDVGLSAKLLKLVNSPLFGFADTIDSVEHAVTLAGMEEVSNLALGISTINFFKDIPKELMDMKSFWIHSINVGILSRLLGKECADVKPDRLFTAGLLHDAGKLIMFKKQPYASVQMLMYARENTVPLVDAEQEVFGFDHTDVAKILLEKWNFPPAMVDLIANHHDPNRAQTSKEAAIIQTADNLANAIEISGGAMYVLSGISEGAYAGIGVPADKLAGIVERYDRHIGEIISAFA